MVWRSLMISKPSRLSRDSFSLLIEQEQTVRVPLEDIAVIVLNHPQISLTHPLLSACAEQGIGLFCLGDNHQPNGMLLPFLTHSRAVRMQRMQNNIGKPLAKRAWAEIVRVKISNQAICLELLQGEPDSYMLSQARQVGSGDKDNIEARASAYYFRQLGGKDFKRSQDCWLNSALDYGYAILRGAIARMLVAHGFLPSIGLFHDSEQNAFNLADDVIEPFRPLVDLHAATKLGTMASGDCALTTADKADLVALLNVDWEMPVGRCNTLTAIEQSIEALARVYEKESEQLLALPRLLGLEAHIVEG